MQTKRFVGKSFSGYIFFILTHTTNSSSLTTYFQDICIIYNVDNSVIVEWIIRDLSYDDALRVMTEENWSKVMKLRYEQPIKNYYVHQIRTRDKILSVIRLFLSLLLESKSSQNQDHLSFAFVQAKSVLPLR